MASLQKKGDAFYCQFVFHGRRRTVTVGKVSSDAAEAFAARTEELLSLLARGRVTVPAGVDIADFVLHDGKAPDPRPAAAAAPVTFRRLKERYLETHSAGAMEPNSLATVAMHLNHFERTLGARFAVQSLTLADLQRHVTARAKKKYRGRPLSPVTLKKEVASFRAAWNWAALSGLVTGPFPAKGLAYPKADEKPPFMTRDEIERRLAAGMTAAERAVLWDCLYLTHAEVDDLLRHVKEHAAHGWVYPLFCLAAHTGARRSEMLRALVSDVDFAGKTVLIREKKRSRKQRTTRRVPLTPFLEGVLREWLAVHPGGLHLFCQAGEVARSKKRSRTTGHRVDKARASSLKGRLATVTRRQLPAAGPVTKDEAHDHFKRTLVGSRWSVLRGFHALRHSFISACASRGVDQRLIDEWTGHSTEEQRKRYRHLYPSTQQEAIGRVFGSLEQ
jgi:integrase